MQKTQELYDKIAASEKLRREFVDLIETAPKGNLAKIQDELVEFAKKQGYKVSPEEIFAFFEGIASAESELSEAELDAVAGGKGSTVTPITMPTNPGMLNTAVRMPNGKCLPPAILK